MIPFFSCARGDCVLPTRSACDHGASALSSREMPIHAEACHVDGQRLPHRPPERRQGDRQGQRSKY
ncbi:hypothetical protein AVEN_107554-1, partial [Araneus ventricosus]